MAFNVATFKKRAFTATLFAIIMLVALLWNQWSFIVLFTTIHFGCWYEFIKLLKKIHPAKYVYYLPAGLLYITMPVCMMIDLYYYKVSAVTGSPFLPLIPMLIIVSIWVNDTMAYIVGSLLGKTPFSSISPNKTWEGTLGGAFLCVIVTGYLAAPALYVHSTLPEIFHRQSLHWFAISAACAVFGTLGDLLESKLKRLADVKDSGTFMPGHGGFLDRFDSILVATPFVWLYVYLFIL